MTLRDMDRDMEFSSNQKAVTREVEVAKTKQTTTWYKWDDVKGEWVPGNRREIVTEDTDPKITWNEYRPADAIGNWVEEFVRCQ